MEAVLRHTRNFEREATFSGYTANVCILYGVERVVQEQNRFVKLNKQNISYGFVLYGMEIPLTLIVLRYYTRTCSPRARVIRLTQLLRYACNPSRYTIRYSYMQVEYDSSNNNKHQSIAVVLFFAYRLYTA